MLTLLILTIITQTTATDRVRLILSAFLNFAIYQETAMTTFLEIKSDVVRLIWCYYYFDSELLN